MIAVSAGREDIVISLVKLGADVNRRNNNGQSPLHYAASKNRGAIAETLATAGAAVNAADANQADKAGNTPLHFACEEDRVEALRFLLEKGGKLDVMNKEEKKPLELAPRRGAINSSGIKSG